MKTPLAMAVALAVLAMQWAAASPGASAFAQAPYSIGRYRLAGAKELQPSEISDDGVHTYIRWRDDQELPAVFTLGPLGEEAMVDGYMRGGVFTIDRVNDHLIFRIDKRAARADRSRGRK